jgi:hypothetical protein
MTKKDYELIAGVLVDTEETSRMVADLDQETAERVLNIVALKFAHILEEENPRFNRELFLTACEVK